MGYVLLMRFADLRGRINMLNRSLSQTNDELVVALGKANEGNRLKSEFLASISHELRTPLNAIINLPEHVLEQVTSARTAACEKCGERFALEPDEQLTSGTPCPLCREAALREASRNVFEGDWDETAQHMQTVVHAGKHLRALVDDLLDASRLELGRAQLHASSFDCTKLVAEVVSSVRTLAQPRGITIEQHLMADTEPTLFADRVRVGQMLYNLLSNAIKFSHDGGTVEVQLSAAAHGELLICVRDHGIGIAPEHHAAVFERFRQVDGGTTRNYGGTGLGLAIAKDLVTLHGGRIWVESERGAGAAFFVQLPRTPSEAANDTSTPLETVALSVGSKRPL
jgi:signal transduction histidine kinase